jgi:DNA primase
MDTSRNDLLGELAGDAALERGDFIVQATEQLRKFLDANSGRIRELGGRTLIDDDPDYLSIAPDLTFRSRSRYLDDEDGKGPLRTGDSLA